ncbi:GntR family transcriptional regulator [Nakamurella lactea]|uniref:GntR family transcriptional regulator n=1 Tax=Nakamurella lactea TaxID=459515 RepID=UPI00041E156C|nr:GntR family transcriptional regulator [Nakamurella lactea]
MAPTRYLEIADELADELADSPTGSRVPSENELTVRFGVGRSAARAAIEELERRNMVRRVKGAGTFVQRPMQFSVKAGGPTAWEQLIRSGVGHTTVPLVRGGTLPRTAAQAMGVPTGTPGLRLSVRMTAYEQPIGRSALWAVGTDRTEVTEGLREHQALLTAIDARQVRLRYRTAEVTLANATADLAAELGIGVDRPYWKIEGVLVDDSRAISVWVRTDFRADRISLVMQIGSGREAGTDSPTARESL